MTNNNKVIIRTSDRKDFRRCRQAWDFKSKIRENWEYIPGAEPLDFGVAIHAALEVYYDPDRWDDDRLIVEQEARLAFTEHMDDWRTRLMRASQWEESRDSWLEHGALGSGMLTYYFRWAPQTDLFWEPVKSEVEFEVPIPVPPDYKLPMGFSQDPQGNLCKEVPGAVYPHFKSVPVVYQGRIDLIMRNKQTKRVYVWDHKTRSKFDSYDHYELDTQAGSYVWALKRVMGVDVAGVIFQDLRKKVPDKPRTLKNGKLSKDKSQATTYELYTATINELGLDVTQYQDFLDWLALNEQQYVRRIQVDRSAKELEIIEGYILDEVVDMLNDPSIYPNPDAFNCNTCKFREVCIMRMDGSDWKWQLEHSPLYEQRT